jgi:class 3 adenylate cyclase/tetratricopeptide (TPR) repeat protein
MSEIRKWLEAIGLGQYANAFETNDIDMDLLRHVDDQTLKDIGVASAGHRLRIRTGIAKLAPTPIAEMNLSSTTDAHETTTRSAERRQLTVMFCDLVGSTALSARLDPEDLRGIISAYHHCCTERVEHNGGFVAKYMGDGVLAYFGYPQAHEHDAERAVRTGLALVEAVPKLAANVGSSLQVRVGIATGLVVVGDLIGTGAAREQAVVGETPNLAARLQALAEPGTVVIAGGTRRLTGGLFDYRDLGTVALKGFAENLPAWQVLGGSAAESRFEALRTATTPLVGREDEIEILQRRWEQAKRGDGQVVLISGEPGIGKSRIAQTLLERVATEPHIRLRYFCSPHHQDSALYPNIKQLERAAGFRREDSPEQRLAKLEDVLARGTNDLSAALPLLADLLSIPTGDRYPPLNLTPRKRKEKTLLVLLAQVAGLSARQPVLMVFEDVHWSDPTSRELLDLLIERLMALPVLVILTFRPEFNPPWIGRPHVLFVTLNRLPPRQRAEMIAHVTAGKALPKEIAVQIVERTDGVPLFIEELTKMVVESGILAEAGDHYELTGAATPLAIPTSLHASLLARLDRLAPTREIAQVGAALGRSFSHELISAVAPMPQPQIDDSLKQLTRAELVFCRGTPPDAEYTFKHALVQDAAYSTLLRRRRQQIHSRIASTLEGRFPEIADAAPQLMAHHCAEAGLTDKAVGYWLKAGQQAVARCAMMEAVAQVQKGLSWLAGLPDGTWRQEQELGLLVALGAALIATRGFSSPEVGETFARASVLTERLDRPDHQFSVLSGLWSYHVARSEHRIALSFAERIEQVGDERNDAARILHGRLLRGVVLFFLGEFVAARGLFEQCHDLQAYRQSFSGLVAEDPYSVMLGYLATTLAYLGYFDQARSRASEGMLEARRLQHAHTLEFNLLFMCWVAFLANSPHDALRCAEEMIDLANEHGFPLWLASGTYYRGASSTAIGYASDGVALLTQAISQFRATGAMVNAPMMLASLADAHGRLGHLSEGLSRLTEAGKIIEATDERQDEALVYRLQGDLLSATGDQAAAERSYRRALAVADRQNAKALELRATTNLACLWRDQGKRTEAHDLLAPIYGWFTEGFDTPVLKDAKTLLDELV